MIGPGITAIWPTGMPGDGPHPAFWVMGSTFERDVDTLPISAEDQMAAHAVNYDKLATLLPASAAPMLLRSSGFEA